MNAKLVRREAESTQPARCSPCCAIDPARRARKLGLDPFVDIDRPTGPRELKAAQQAAHRAADNDCTPRASSGNLFGLGIFSFTHLSYI